MKVEMMRLPEKGICLVISEFTPDILSTLNITNPNSPSSVFSDPYIIADCLKDGQKIAAIKEVRAQTGWGLREAKHYIDKYMPMQVDHTPMRCLGYAKNFIQDHTDVDFIEDAEMRL